jgi:hypothetical protein
MKDRHQISSYPLRLPPNLRAALSVAAAANRRSLHNEIVLRLENTCRAPAQTQGAAQ